MGIGFIVSFCFYVFSATHVTTNNAQVRQYIVPAASRVSGYIKEVRFEENQLVHKGDTLVVIDPREYQYEVDKVNADLSSAAAVNSYEAAAQVKSSEIAIIEANIKVAKIELWHAEQKYLRFKALVKEDAATVQQFETKDAHYQQAQAKLLGLEKEKIAAQTNTLAEQSKLAPVKSQVVQQHAQLNNAQLHVAYTYVLAPYDGWVGVRNIQPGQLVKEGQALVQVVSKEKWIVANFKETQIGAIDTSRFITIVSDAYPSITFKGKVASFSAAAGSEFSLVKPDNATGNFVKIEQRFPVKIWLLKEEHTDLLRAGMNVSISAQSK